MGCQGENLKQERGSNDLKRTSHGTEDGFIIDPLLSRLFVVLGVVPVMRALVVLAAGGFIIGFIDAGDFVVVGLFFSRCRSISRRSRKSPRFPYMLSPLFRFRLERERRRMERLSSYCSCCCFFVLLSSPFSLLENVKERERRPFLMGAVSQSLMGLVVSLGE
jgi:hypothetical protein